MIEIVDLLIRKGKELFEQPYKTISFTGDSNADNLLNDLHIYPHAFVLACIMDRQMGSARAWLIPYKISQEIGGFDFKRLFTLSLDEVKNLFHKNNFHRFNEIMSVNFYHAIQTINEKYNSNASSIWADSPKSATIIRRFLEFKGVGVKISSMATNILVREFKLPVANKFFLDISPDVHTRRVFKRTGLINQNATDDELIFRARELNPEYPGIFDLPTWDIGRNWCRPKHPKCGKCYLQTYCNQMGICTVSELSTQKREKIEASFSCSLIPLYLANLFTIYLHPVQTCQIFPFSSGF